MIARLIKCDILTWTKLFDSPIAVDVYRQEVLEPSDLWVRVPTGSTEHRGCSCSLNHFQLRAHVYGGEAMRNLVFCNKNNKKQVKLGAKKGIIYKIRIMILNNTMTATNQGLEMWDKCNCPAKANPGQFSLVHWINSLQLSSIQKKTFLCINKIKTWQRLIHRTFVYRYSNM